MLEQLPKSDLREAAIAAVDEMIVYSDTNMENAHGISICYPYSTNEAYTEAYMEIRKEIDFADSYGEFLESFYAIKNGESLVNTWEFRYSTTGINTIAAGKEGDADVRDVSLQLTPEHRRILQWQSI